MMRQPPAAVPAAMVIAETILIHVEISTPLSGVASANRRKESQFGRSSNTPDLVATTRVRAMIPMAPALMTLPH